MYAFCAICSGVVIRFLCPDYQERPLKMLDWSSGTIFPFSVRFVLLKFGLIVTEALLLPLLIVINPGAEIPLP